MPLNDPPVFLRINPHLRSSCDTIVDQPVAGRKPYFTAPGTGSDHFSNIQALDTFGKSFTIGSGVFIAKHHDVAP